MENNDPINVAYSEIVEYGLTEADKAALRQSAFEQEVLAVHRTLQKHADFLAETFDMFVVAAAVEILMNDYEEATYDEGDDT